MNALISTTGVGGGRGPNPCFASDQIQRLAQEPTVPSFHGFLNV